MANIVVANLGVGSESWTVDVVDGTNRQRVINDPIGWRVVDGHQCHDLGWLGLQIDALPALAGMGGVISVALPGADLALLNERGEICAPLQHYRSISLSPETVLRESGVSAAELYIASGGATVASFQPPFQLLSYKERWPEEFATATTVVTLADWVTARLTGSEVRADPHMAQSQGIAARGLAASRLAAIWERLGIPSGTYDKVEVPLYPEDGLLMGSCGAYVVPATHDSLFARVVAFTAAPWCLWTGGWVGWSYQTAGQCLPSEELLNARAAFEGRGHLAGIAGNTAMFGPAYRYLVETYFGGNFEAAAYDANKVRATIGLARDLLDLNKTVGEPAKVVAALVDECGSPDLAAFMYLEAAVRACIADLSDAASALRVDEPEIVSLVGGWAENGAFRNILGGLGIRTAVPPCAHDATVIGAAADAYWRYYKLKGREIPLSRALSLLSG